MRKPKEEPFTLTHTEILCFAITTVSEHYMKEKETNRLWQTTNPEFVSTHWKDKLTALLSLYKMETGKDYGYDFDDEE